jgi:hypothetical protein
LAGIGLAGGGEGKWPVVSGEWLVLHARCTAQSNPVKPVKPVKPGGLEIKIKIKITIRRSYPIPLAPERASGLNAGRRYVF